ncbi:MAG: hypothetical protein JWQ50_6481 [Caballeronia mineralivorans]|jgi:hypothetical protein|nr:hypothetical protein [Caballeronia mineralivorans]
MKDVMLISSYVNHPALKGARLVSSNLIDQPKLRAISQLRCTEVKDSPWNASSVPGSETCSRRQALGRRETGCEEVLPYPERD